MVDVAGIGPAVMQAATCTVNGRSYFRLTCELTSTHSSPYPPDEPSALTDRHWCPLRPQDSIRSYAKLSPLQEHPRFAACTAPPPSSLPDTPSLTCQRFASGQDRTPCNESAAAALVRGTCRTKEGDGALRSGKVEVGRLLQCQRQPRLAMPVVLPHLTLGGGVSPRLPAVDREGNDAAAPAPALVDLPPLASPTSMLFSFSHADIVTFHQQLSAVVGTRIVGGVADEQRIRKARVANE
ncbi:hypothetical protein R3P38DRAFT_3215453 [Favolaschia claudopus]|uniref:Uncharacterized protein n=1 Tax=Favolaschia claudopus TaxID=2862362 RepID=A0AAW0A8T7_9AGAR